MPGRGSRALRWALIVAGVVAIGALYPLMLLWPGGFRWNPPQGEYEQMIVGLYATLGVFLLRAAREPLRHLSLIWFAVWSSVVHAGIMAVHAWRAPDERGHFAGDIALLLVLALVLGLLTPRTAEAAGDAAGSDAAR